MSDPDKFCPTCEARRRWYNETCPECGGALIEDVDARAQASLPTVVVLTTEDVGRIPLAQMALDEAGIGFRMETRAHGVVLLVSPERADDARALLAELESADTAAALPLEETGEWQEEIPPVELFDGATGQTLGHVTEDLIEWLLAELDPDDTGVQELPITPKVLDALARSSGDATLLEMLRDGLGRRREMMLRWSLR